MDPLVKSPPITFAWRRVRLYRAADGGTLGLDQDGVCTCDGTSLQKCLGPNVCDGPNGRDNAGIKLIAALDLLNGSPLEASLRKGIDAGQWSVILRIEDYDETDDDASLTLRWYFSRGFADAMAKPAWNGKDVWTVNERSLEPMAMGKLDAARFEDKTAYVSGGVLVATFTEAVLEALGGKTVLPLRLSQAKLVATLRKGADGWRLDDGIVAARLSEKDAFGTIAGFRSDAGTLICSDESSFQTLTQLVCDARDLPSSNAGPTQPCEAVSLALGFDASPAATPIVVPKPLPPMGCAMGKDPAAATCSMPK
jgi:hypothetical protein